MLNGINLKGLQQYVDLIKNAPNEAKSSYGITATWDGGVKTIVNTHNQKVGSKEIKKDFHFQIGEPKELLGDNSLPTPQDYLLGGLAGCMMVGFVVEASKRDIQLKSVKLTIEGDLDLRGFLKISADVPIGFDKVFFHFDVEGNGSKEQYDEIVASVQQFSPNYKTIADPVEFALR
ncbi:OsmC family protein [Xanthovirga aplysinae]|uniref:OsmC family protein n=1 Tax=Xanthovirga aplysinae TaxID=2529853 RepID=UPI0012BC63B0|nr:OsmC family protein [Xanthovirga aplysinae]MTI30158.1 OsmC family peroxiredoxin [Xanthovirga aplysinae]